MKLNKNKSENVPSEHLSFWQIFMPHIFGDAGPNPSNAKGNKQAFSVMTILVRILIPDGD